MSWNISRRFLLWRLFFGILWLGLFFVWFCWGFFAFSLEHREVFCFSRETDTWIYHHYTEGRVTNRECYHGRPLYISLITVVEVSEARANSSINIKTVRISLEKSNSQLFLSTTHLFFLFFLFVCLTLDRINSLMSPQNLMYGRTYS